MTGLSTDLSGPVATVTIDQPPVNALSLALCEEIAATFAGFAHSDTVHCVILTGAGTRAFCAGIDLREVQQSPDQEPLRASARRTMYEAVYTCAVPVIAAVNGPCLGAGSVIASVCDIRLAAAWATFGLPEITVGRIGGAAHHARLIGQGALRRLVFTGRPASAADAYRLGLVDEVVEGDLLAAARALAGEIAAKSPLGLRVAKQALNEIESRTVAEGYALEQAHNARLMETADAREATRALLEKRAPVFTGR
jgi:enoyl-CoA hydratase